MLIVELAALLPPAAWRSCRFARADRLDDRISAAHQAAVDAVLDEHLPGSVLHRDGLTVRANRFGWVARRALASRIVRL